MNGPDKSLGTPLPSLPRIFSAARRVWPTPLLCGWLALATALAAAQQPPAWKTGPAFDRQLEEPVDGVTWEDRGLADGLARLSQTYAVAIFLDRRIDPNQELTLTVRDQPLRALLLRIAASARAGLSTVGPVVYIGPPETAAQLATLAALRRQDAAKLSGEARSRLLRVEPWQWDELAQPRQLLDALAARASVAVQNADAIPLDLWRATSLPPLAWTDRVTLLLAGFGLTFQCDQAGRSIRLAPPPAAVTVEKTYAPRGSAAQMATQLARVLSGATIRVEGDKLLIAASQEEHEKIERLLAGQSVRAARPAKTGGEKLYSLQVASEPAGKVARKVAESLGKELKYDPRVLEKLKQPVTFQLENASLEHLLTTTLKPLGLTYRLTADALEIVERE